MLDRFSIVFMMTYLQPSILLFLRAKMETLSTSKSPDSVLYIKRISKELIKWYIKKLNDSQYIWYNANLMKNLA